MLKKILVITILSMMIFQTSAFAVETEGEVIFRDALYGAGIGALLGAALYIADDDDFGSKISTGLLVGTIAGLVVGFAETRSFVEMNQDEIKIAVPTPIIRKEKNGIQYSASLLKAEF